MPPMDDDRFRELATALLLWGLEPDEQAEFERELERRGADGEAELTRLREAIAAVAMQAPAVAPPDYLRARVTEGIATGSEEGGSTHFTSIGWRTLPWVAAALVAGCFALQLGVWNVRLRDEVQGLRREVAAARGGMARVDSLESQVEAYRRDVDALASPAGSAHTLVGTETEPNARARVFIDPATSRAILFVYELPVLQAGTVYELWAIRDGTPAGAGTFVTGADGRARIELDPGVIEGADVLAVTVEPAPGVAAPTGPMVLASPSS